MEPIAVIADPHFHDIDFRQGAGRSELSAVRTLADTAASTRVFNESFHALRWVLDDIVQRGISLVIVVGDLTDDGQASTMAAATALLDDYAHRHGLRFLATPGNHDLYAVHGRHQSKRFLDPEGGHTLVTSDAAAAQGESSARIVSPEMYCGGYESALSAMRSLGFFRRSGDLHWESPFGPSDALADRTFAIRSEDGRTVRQIIDASYLVETKPGLWILSIDANVFEPRNGDLDPTAESSWIDSTDAGWNSVLRNKPFLLDWMADVALRAETLGKHLLVFSHYPILNPLGDTLADEVRLFGETGLSRRAPGPAVARAAAATGIRVHLSGHLHVNDTAVWREGGRFLVNIAVPSTVGFPPAYKLVELDGNRMVVETVPVDEARHHATAFALYRAEIARNGADHGDLARATSHADFLDRHLALLVLHRYLPKEWPEDLAERVLRQDLGDLDRLALGTEASELRQDLRSISFLEMVVDWYRLRKGRELAFDLIERDRQAAYRSLASRFAARSWEAGSPQDRLARFMRMMIAYMDGHPSRDFAIDLVTGEIEAVGHLGRTERRQTGMA